MATKGKLSERLTMKGQIHKAYKVVLKLQNPRFLKQDQKIPLKILRNAKGIAFITVIKAGFMFSGTLGSGIVIARLPDGSWSGPSSIGVGGMGWGALVGASSTDSVIILNTNMAVRAFSGKGQVKFGGNLSVAVGPLGREADGSVYGGDGGAAACYSYSHSRGLFGGLSLQGAILGARPGDNKKFYGVECTPQDILTGKVRPPPNEDLQLLYRCLHAVDTGVAMDVRMTSSGSIHLASSTDHSYDYSEDMSGYAFHEPIGSSSSIGPDYAHQQSSPYLNSSHSRTLQQITPISALPSGWREVKTENGDVYYWNEEKNITQWERPVENAFRPAPPVPPVPSAPNRQSSFGNDQIPTAVAIMSSKPIQRPVPAPAQISASRGAEDGNYNPFTTKSPQEFQQHNVAQQVSQAPVIPPRTYMSRT